MIPTADALRAKHPNAGELWVKPLVTKSEVEA